MMLGQMFSWDTQPSLALQPLCSQHPFSFSVLIVQCPSSAVVKYFAFAFCLQAVLCAEPKGLPRDT